MLVSLHTISLRMSRNRPASGIFAPASLPLRPERVELVRTPVDRPAKVDGDYRERSLEAEEHREEAVVSKEARVVEEIGLRKTSDMRQETVTEAVRHTEVEVDDERSTSGRDDLERTRT